jgi:hypothetical protein
VKRWTNARAESATSRQPLSIVNAIRGRDLDDLGHAFVSLLALVGG